MTAPSSISSHSARRNGPGTAPPVANHWPDAKCAKAFWSQQDLPAYRQLLRDTVDWADPQPRARWLDLGCGGGAVTRALWGRTLGQIGEITGLDVAEVNATAYQRMWQSLPNAGDRIRFLHHDFSAGLAPLASSCYDGVVSGLAITYAESWDPVAGRWTTEAYDRLLAEVYRVLRDGGRFVFSVNVPHLSWVRVAAASLGGIRQAARPLRWLKNSGRMLRYGQWLKREAARGRFHYPTATDVTERLAAVGFTDIEHRISYVGQAYVFRTNKAGAPPRADRG